jgi:PH (Pleckstrin Homology) domain-containing protein
VSDPEQIAREKDRLPRGWGRFGKAIAATAEQFQPEEPLLSSCVGLNPSFQHRTITLAGAMRELQKSTNVVLAASDRRIVVASTGIAGGQRDSLSIPYDGLEIVDVAKKELTLRWPDGEMHVKGIAKQMLPGFVDAVSGELGD